MSSVSFLVFEPKVLMMNTLLRLVVQFSLNFLSNSNSFVFCKRACGLSPRSILFNTGI